MTIMNLYLDELIKLIIKSNTIDNILDLVEDDSKKGQLYERLWDIIIKFGFCSLFNNDKYTHKCGNSNKVEYKNLVSLKKYIKDNKIISGNSGGCSDITLYDNNNNEWIFISCKYFKSDSKSIYLYGIQELISMIDDNKDIYKNYKIYICVRN